MRLSIDSLGLREIEQLPSMPAGQASQSETQTFVVQDIETFYGVLALFEVCLFFAFSRTITDVASMDYLASLSHLFFVTLGHIPA